MPLGMHSAGSDALRAQGPSQPSARPAFRPLGRLGAAARRLAFGPSLGHRATNPERTATGWRVEGLPRVGGSARARRPCRGSRALPAGLTQPETAGPPVTGREGSVLTFTPEPRRRGRASPPDRPQEPASLLAGGGRAGRFGDGEPRLPRPLSLRRERAAASEATLFSGLRRGLCLRLFSAWSGL